MASDRNLPVQEIVTRQAEMDACDQAYTSDPLSLSRYSLTSRFYSDVYDWRVLNFMIRHNLVQQFKAEDDVGIRGNQ